MKIKMKSRWEPSAEFATIATIKGTGLTSALRRKVLMDKNSMGTATHVKIGAIELLTAGEIRETREKGHSGENLGLKKLPKTLKNRSMLLWGLAQV